MFLDITKSLNNHYFFLRHGQSKPNIKNIVISHIEDGKKNKWALTKAGEKQVKESVKKAKSDKLLNKDVIIYSSPFSRCKKTAEIAKEILGVKSLIIFDDRLRERWFGDLEKSHSDSYHKVWEEDKKNNSRSIFNVESVLSVKDRILEIIEELEKKYKNKSILIVSHGDPLQIAQTFFGKKEISHHRDIKHLEPAEIRELKII